MPSVKSLNLSIAVLYCFAADTLLYTVTLTSDLVTLTSDLWPWTFATYRLWRVETIDWCRHRWPWM